ncbi:MAG TPA: hypothetical protein VMW50_10330 [Dehalococcoidia bacterium]|nr:hypothetical protein [Dehalococcoidia bacterium]
MDILERKNIEEKRKYLESPFYLSIAVKFKERIISVLHELSEEGDEAKVRRLQGELKGLQRFFIIDREFKEKLGLTPLSGGNPILKRLLEE